MSASADAIPRPRLLRTWPRGRAALARRAALVFTMVVACDGSARESDAGASSSDAGPPIVDGATALTPAPRTLTLPFGPCPAGFVSECATGRVPLDWESPDGPGIDLFVARHRARTAKRAELWLLQGGPGDSASVFAPLVEALAEERPDLEILTLEHRGVGRSTRLGCAIEEGAASPEASSITESEWPACLAALDRQWGARLQHFNRTQAARDLAAAVAATHEPGAALYLYGGSYGTTWALEYLRLHPGEASGAVLDSLAAPGYLFASQLDLGFDPVARRFADACRSDAVCGAKLGADPWQRVRAAVEKAAAGGCPSGGLDRSAASRALSIFLRSRPLRTLFFPVVHRLDRCNAGDAQALIHLARELERRSVPSAAAGVPEASAVLRAHISISELWESPAPSPETLAERCRTAVVCPGASEAWGRLYARWPRYAPPPAPAAPVTTAPLLVLNGELDPQTPIENARAAAAAFAAPAQRLVALPHTPHNAVNNSLVRGARTPPCGYQLLLQFLADPRDTRAACVADVAPPAFAVDAATARSFLGTDDAWEGAPITRAAGPATPAVWHRALAAAERLGAP